ncbi:MAG: 30S ribosomal protein S4 [Alphaproteobacteria bacterium]|nr:30S ribosomal protein S4 [Alphaproteobacteria bacterium]
MKRKQRKFRLSRRIGQPLWGQAKDPSNDRNYGPGQHGVRRGVLSGYGEQLRAMQKFKIYYGLKEKALSRLYKMAVRLKGDSSEHLIGLLETRLASFVYRSKLAPTIFSANQFVVHKHVKVNGRICNCPSRLLKVGDKVELVTKAHQIPAVIQAIADNSRDVPEYIRVDHGHFAAELVSVPHLDDVPYPVVMQPNLVVEYYSQ